jgi:hypothetical protein
MENKPEKEAWSPAIGLRQGFMKMNHLEVVGEDYLLVVFRFIGDRLQISS